MPKVGDKEFSYDSEGIKAAAKESMESGIPVSNGAERSVQSYAGGGKTGYASIGSALENLKDFGKKRKELRDKLGKKTKPPKSPKKLEALEKKYADKKALGGKINPGIKETRWYGAPKPDEPMREVDEYKKGGKTKGQKRRAKRRWIKGKTEGSPLHWSGKSLYDTEKGRTLNPAEETIYKAKKKKKTDMQAAKDKHKEKMKEAKAQDPARNKDDRERQQKAHESDSFWNLKPEKREDRPETKKEKRQLKRGTRRDFRKTKRDIRKTARQEVRKGRKEKRELKRKGRQTWREYKKSDAKHLYLEDGGKVKK